MSIDKYIKTREELKAIIKKYIRECRLEAREAREARSKTEAEQAANVCERKRQKETM